MSLIAEQEVISAVLTGNIGDVDSILSPEMFTQPVLGKVFAVYQLANREGREANLSEVLSHMGVSESRARDILTECAALPVTWIAVKQNAEIIRDEYRARKVSEALRKIRIDGANIDKVLAETIKGLQSYEVERRSGMSVSEITEANSGDYFTDKQKDTIKIGFKILDDACGGIEKGDVAVIAARPAVGKSAFALQIIGNLAKEGKRIAYYNLEMRDKQIYERMIAQESGIPLNRIRFGINFLGDEQVRFQKANEILRQRKNVIIHSGVKSVSDIRADAKSYDVIVVDYLQLLKPDRSSGVRYVEVGDISRGLKGIAMTYDIPVIALSQLNRAPEARGGREPSMSDLRESGDIEQDASVILMMWEPDENDQSKKMVKVEKARMGTRKRQAFRFDGRYMQFVPEDEFHEEPDDDVPFD